MGVILGFGLGELSRIIRGWYHCRRLKKALFDELVVNYHLIDQKKGNLSQIIDALENKQILRGESVHAATTIYDSCISEIIGSLQPIYRDNLHIIYERLKMNDTLLDHFYSGVTRDIQQQILRDPWLAYKKQLTDMSNSYAIVQSLIKDVVAKSPQDVMYRHSKK
ncbi:MAG: hypothetical protein ABIJ04_05585 [Bacteroidota bacterium]